MKPITTAIVAILLTAGAMSADNLYSNLAPPTCCDPGWDQYHLGDVTGWSYDASGPISQAMSFQPNETATLDSVFVVVNRFDLCQSDYTVQVMSDNVGEPGTVLASVDELGQTLTLQTEGEVMLFQTHPILTAGQTYWVNVFEKPSTSMYQILWRYNETGDPGTPEVSTDYGQNWSNGVFLFGATETPGAFSVYGTAVATPEPSSALMFLTAGVALVVVGRRTRFRN